MTKKNFTYNFIEKTIIGSKAAINAANKGLEPEYSELCEMMSKQPTFTIAVKTIKKNENKKTYGKLTFEVMEEYIKTQPNSEENLVLFEAVKKVAAAKNSKYPLTKKWFLNAFPSYKENEIEAEETKVLCEEIAKAKAEEAAKAEAEKALAELDNVVDIKEAV